MRRFTSMMALILVACLAAHASAVTMLFDFGYNDSLPNVNPVEPNAQDVANAIDTTGSLTGVSLTVDLVNSTGWYPTSENSNGTTSPTAPAADYFSSAITEDNLYGNADQDWYGVRCTNIIYNIAGLVPNTAYDYTFFASRMGSSDNREASYSVDGNTVLLNAVGNTSAMAQLTGIVSDESGHATLAIAKGPNNNNSYGFFYLGGMQINTTIPEPGSIFLLALAGLGFMVAWRKRR